MTGWLQSPKTTVVDRVGLAAQRGARDLSGRPAEVDGETAPYADPGDRAGSGPGLGQGGQEFDASGPGLDQHVEHRHGRTVVGVDLEDRPVAETVHVEQVGGGAVAEADRGPQHVRDALVRLVGVLEVRPGDGAPCGGPAEALRPACIEELGGACDEGGGGLLEVDAIAGEQPDERGEVAVGGLAEVAVAHPFLQPAAGGADLGQVELVLELGDGGGVGGVLAEFRRGGPVVLEELPDQFLGVGDALGVVGTVLRGPVVVVDQDLASRAGRGVGHGRRDQPCLPELAGTLEQRVDLGEVAACPGCTRSARRASCTSRRCLAGCHHQPLPPQTLVEMARVQPATLPEVLRNRLRESWKRRVVLACQPGNCATQ